MEKNEIVRLTILSICTMLIGQFIIFGDNGLVRYFKKQKEITHEVAKIDKLEAKIKNIEQEIVRWKTDDFELEKMARSELMMGYPGEKVYYLPKS